jgi:hypothetical protein
MNCFEEAAEQLLNEHHLIAREGGLELYLPSHDYKSGVLIRNTGVHPEMPAREVFIPRGKFELLMKLLEKYHIWMKHTYTVDKPTGPSSWGLRSEDNKWLNENC